MDTERFFAEINRSCWVSARVSHLYAALEKQPLTLVLTAPNEYRLQFLARCTIIVVSSSTVTYICITEECASDKCAEIAAFFSRRCSTCSRTTKMSRTCGTTGKSKHPFLWIRNKDGEIICLSILFAFPESSVRFTTRNYHNLYIKVLFCLENEHFVNFKLPFPSRCDTI